MIKKNNEINSASKAYSIRKNPTHLTMGKKLVTIPLLCALGMLLSCSEDSDSLPVGIDETPKDETVLGSDLYVFGSDYQSGELRWLENGSLSEESLKFSQDAKVVAVSDNLFVLEGYGADNVNLVDPEKHEVTWQISLDDASNPKDVVLADSLTAWVALEGVEKFVKISLKNGAEVDSVNTSSFTQEGGVTPGLIDFEASGDTLFALFQRYVYDGATYSTTFPATGLVALYNLDSGKLLDTIALETRNPSAMALHEGNLYVTTMGEYNEFFGTDSDGLRGIEKVDLKNKKSALVASGEILGGGVYNAVLDEDAGVIYGAIYKSFGDVPVVAFDLGESFVEELQIQDGEGGLAFDLTQGLLYVGDRTSGSESVLVYDGQSVEKLDTDEALPPYGLCVLYH